MLSGIDPKLKFEVHSIRPLIRVDWLGKPRLQWVIELTKEDPAVSGSRRRAEEGQRTGLPLPWRLHASGGRGKRQSPL